MALTHTHEHSHTLKYTHKSATRSKCVVRMNFCHCIRLSAGFHLWNYVTKRFAVVAELFFWVFCVCFFVWVCVSVCPSVDEQCCWSCVIGRNLICSQEILNRPKIRTRLDNLFTIPRQARASREVSGWQRKKESGIMRREKEIDKKSTEKNKHDKKIREISEHLLSETEAHQTQPLKQRSQASTRIPCSQDDQQSTLTVR